MQVISSHIPIYKQIIYSICSNIDNGLLKHDYAIPSVNNVASEFSLARGFVFTAYNELKSLGIIKSISGKGCFVVSTLKPIHLKGTFLLSKDKLTEELQEALKGLKLLNSNYNYYKNNNK